MPPDLTGGSSAVSLAAWLACAAFLAGLINSVLALVDRIKEKPIPSETYLRIADWSDHRDQILARIESVRVAGEADRAALRSETAELRGEIRDDIRRLHQRMDDLPTQLIATLRNTGAIH